jgi:hypothetical protein
MQEHRKTKTQEHRNTRTKEHRNKYKHKQTGPAKGVVLDYLWKPMLDWSSTGTQENRNTETQEQIQQLDPPRSSLGLTLEANA